MGSPPKPRVNIEFLDPDQHDDLVLLRKEIHRVLMDLRGKMTKGGDREVLIQFACNLHPGAFADAGRLPRESSTKSQRKEEKLFARISQLIQAYWDLVLCPEEANVVKIKEELAALREWA